MTETPPRAIAHDEKLYPDPDQFLPERFLKQEGKKQQLDPILGGAFGFGRRYIYLLVGLGDNICD